MKETFDGGVVWTLWVTEAVFCRRGNQRGGTKAAEAKCLKDLDKGKTRLQLLVAEQVLDISMLT